MPTNTPSKKINSSDAPITRADEIVELARELRKHSLICADTEFIREHSFFPSVELIQVGTRERTWLIDAQSFKNRKEELKPFLDVLLEPSILKILHAAQGDQECFFSEYGITAKPSFDTAIGASLCGLGDGIGLGNLLKSLLGIQVKKGHARTNWAARPLPIQLIQYAHADVEYLVEASELLFVKLDQLGRRKWALELSAQWEDHQKYTSDPLDLSLKLAQGGKLDPVSFMVLFELMKWRETRVRQLNLPRRWVADDQFLIDLAKVKPQTVQHLSTFRGINKGEVKASGEKIIRIIAQALEEAAQGKRLELPKSKKEFSPTPEQSHAIDLIKTYVSFLADREKIAVKHLMTSKKFLRLMKQEFHSVDEMIQAGVMSEGAAQLIGEEVLSLVQGKKALSIQQGKIRLTSL